jgi:hypothetical protein
LPNHDVIILLQRVRFLYKYSEIVRWLLLHSTTTALKNSLD